MHSAIRKVIFQLSESLQPLTAEQFVRPCKTLFNSTIGQHVRHIIEMYQCLQAGYPGGMVNYEERKRDQEIETNKTVSLAALDEILEGLHTGNKELSLVLSYDEEDELPDTVTTNYLRELAYNLEHSIHHMALIRIGLAEISDRPVSEGYGVASSTLKYRAQCAQ